MGSSLWASGKNTATYNPRTVSYCLLLILLQTVGITVKVWKNFRKFPEVSLSADTKSRANTKLDPVIQELGWGWVHPHLLSILSWVKKSSRTALPSRLWLSKGCVMWSGQTLLTKLSPHWKTNFAYLNNFCLRNEFSSHYPHWLLQFQNNETSRRHHTHQQTVQGSFGSRFHYFTGPPYVWGKCHLPEVMLISLFQGISFKRKSSFLKQTYVFWVRNYKLKN